MVTQQINRTANIQLNKDLLSLHFISKATTDTQLTKLKKDLLSHLNRHPRAKFSAGAIPRDVSRVRKVDLVEALEGLVTDELIEKHTNQQGQPLYCLTTNPKKQEPVLRSPASNVNGNGTCQPLSTLGSGQMLIKVRQLRLLEEPVFVA